MDSVAFGQAADLLEEIKEDLDNSWADYLLEFWVARQWEEDEVPPTQRSPISVGKLPPKVRDASRSAFKASGMHGLAAADMDPVKHHQVAATAHRTAADVAKEHDQPVLSHTHRVRASFHDKEAKAAVGREESRQPGMKLRSRMSPAARAADTDQLDREYIRQRQLRKQAQAADKAAGKKAKKEATY